MKCANLSRANTPQGEWFLNPQTAHLIWKVFGEAEIDLFALYGT